ncbi:MAG: hypothetical protein P4L56_07315 [Candidatus Sulfopaludibacter sp.]|nr:hypothetical protein [Candidatus Sulfopaludibacter sp.]
MRKIRFVGVRIVLFGILGVGLLGLLLTGLWNALMPAILGLPAIGFWQALGLFLLSRLLFGRFGGWGHRMRRSRFVRGWKDLTPEERQRFSRAMDPCRPGNTAETSPET